LRPSGGIVARSRLRESAPEEQEWKAYYRAVYPDWWVGRAKTLAWSSYDQTLLDWLDARPGEAVLECGIGTGERYALRLARRGVRVFGVDLAESLLKACAANCARAGVHIALQQGDMEALPYDDGAFDRVYCFSSLWYLPHVEHALREMFRVSRLGGAIVFDMMNAFHVTPALAFLAAAVKRRLGRSAGRWRPHGPWEIERILRRCGATWRLQGFGVLLPTALPIVGDRANLARRWRLTDVGLRDSPLRYLGARLVYACRRST